MHPLFKSNLKFVLGCTIMALMCGMAVFAAISPDLSISTTCNLAQANISPLTDQRHPLGTDGLGRDLAAMLASGAQGSLSVGIFAAVGATIFGNLWEPSLQSPEDMPKKSPCASSTLYCRYHP